VARLWAGKPGVPFLVGARNCSILQNVQADCGAHPVSYSLGTSGGKAARV
jgi:hypothetical protein